MTTIQQALRETQQQLASRLKLETREARNEARMLLSHALSHVPANIPVDASSHVDHAWLIAHENDPMPLEAASRFNALVERRLAGEPVAYILGSREFFGLQLAVSAATLIPRPDTETLVETALAHIPSHERCLVLDLGTGTGAIALAIAAHRPQAQVTAVDASADALQIARHNAATLGLAAAPMQEGTGQKSIGNVEFRLGSWFSPLAGSRFDVIVSNPPYIRQDDPHLQQGDLRHEPVSALASGVDGLDDLRIIIRQAPLHLQPAGWLMLEHGYDQAEAVAALMNDSGFTHIRHVDDLAGIARVTLGQWRSEA